MVYRVSQLLNRDFLLRDIVVHVGITFSIDIFTSIVMKVNLINVSCQVQPVEDNVHLVCMSLQVFDEEGHHCYRGVIVRCLSFYRSNVTPLVKFPKSRFCSLPSKKNESRPGLSNSPISRRVGGLTLEVSYVPNKRANKKILESHFKMQTFLMMSHVPLAWRGRYLISLRKFVF